VPRMPILSASSSMTAPDCSLSTMKVEMPRAPALGSVFGEHHVVARRAAVADPVLLAAQAPALAFARRRGLDRGGIRAGAALGQRKARRHALRHLTEVMLLLVVASGQQDGKRAELVGA